MKEMTAATRSHEELTGNRKREPSPSPDPKSAAQTEAYAGSCDVVIIGAGPYGLSIAAHLRAEGVRFRIFGSVMHTWREQMPEGMRLKSEGFASSLYDANSKFPLASYCREKNLPYADTGHPVPIETFIGYGIEFQKRFVPNVENKLVVSLQPVDGGFKLGLEDGETLFAPRVIVAVGLSYYSHVPPVFSDLPESHVTHSSCHKKVDCFNNRKVAIIGAGSSALDLAALLHQAGAHVQVIARSPEIRLFDPPEPHPTSLVGHLRNPVSGLGRGWKLYLCANAPLVFRLMPEQFRLDRVRRVLGPAPSWFIKPEIEGKVPLRTGLSIRDAEARNGKVRLGLVKTDGKVESLETDHVIAATGYRVDLRRVKFMEACLPRLRCVEYTPVLSSNFESSLGGLYFVGASAANTFGPLLRFAAGAKFTATRLAKHLAKEIARD